MNISFEGKRVLVTGAGQGIGRDLALRLSEYKATVIAISRTKKFLETLRHEDPKIMTLEMDLRDWDASRAAVKRFLPIDMVVNNAGVATLAPFLQLTKEDFDLTMDVNVKAIFNISQIVADDLIKRKCGGSIVNVSSQASQAAIKDHAIYCASKGAVDMLTKTMALELGPHKIRVNSVNPTVVMTAMGKLGWEDPEKARVMLDKIPLGRFAEVDEVIDAIVYLLSDRSSMITGAALPVDGGFLAT
ncbi:L-xylulose reductase [Fopius arisanus]|uniref:L-xylulose reductase n=1 Tax=Fopius arisanus TaxID=64838 RepID=A0A9R1TLZ6_9HYME|nr:PREDICTED: L-xylulose reductase [Fopius arisanus]XP_011313229.1 PREDICTED: L-xylulose reductase [Fopius arisanus]XP_011313238.1 PREDICTED: L-xylulose reductase [Fopius arisanus]